MRREEEEEEEEKPREMREWATGLMTHLMLAALVLSHIFVPLPPVCRV